jgi:hypothetical protein
MAINTQKKGSILLIKGIDTSLPAEYIGDNSARNSENFEMSRGVLTKRDGTTQLGDTIGGTDVEIMHGREFVREGVSYNVRIGRDKIERYNVASTAWVDITGTVDLTGISTDLVDTAVPLLTSKRILCITNNKDAIRKWTGSGNTASLGGSPPVAKFIQEYKTYLVCANIGGGTDVSQRVQWSHTADPENWTGGNSGSVDLIEEGTDITGLSTYGNYLCVHKKDAIYLGSLINTSSIFLFTRKAAVGTIANGSIVNLPNNLQIYLAENGLHLFDGVSSKRIDSAANDEINDTLNREYTSKTWGVLNKEDKEAWIGIPVGSQQYGETVYKYNYESGTILKDTRANMNTAWIGEASSGLTWDDINVTWDSYPERWDGTAASSGSSVINLSDSNGFTYNVSTLTKDDDGAAVTAKWVTKDFQDSQQRLARWQRVEVWGKGDSVTVEYSTDQGETWTELTGSPITLSDQYPSFDAPDILWLDTISSTLRLRFSNATSEEACAIKQFIISYVPQGERK